MILFIECVVAFAIIGLLYWERRKLQTGPCQPRPDLAAGRDISSLAESLLHLSQAVDKSVSPEESSNRIRSRERS
ncbi:MAG: hypothetical protein M1436_10495 [Acidobacteria bacterium]|nr:hypothetical protein [Acidobacteriota bacterium]